MTPPDAARRPDAAAPDPGGTSPGPDDDAPVVVDALGKACPMPVLDLAAAVKAATTGTTFHLLADDGAARVDVPIWCRMQRQRLDDVVDEPDHIRFVVTKVRETRDPG